MNIVFDTNVLIAAYISPNGRAYQTLKYCLTHHRVFCSAFILDELYKSYAVN